MTHSRRLLARYWSLNIVLPQASSVVTRLQHVQPRINVLFERLIQLNTDASRTRSLEFPPPTYSCTPMEICGESRKRRRNATLGLGLGKALIVARSMDMH